MGRGALGVAAAVAVAAAAGWFLLRPGSDGPGPGEGDGPAAEALEETEGGSPSLASGRARPEAAAPTTRAADFRVAGKVVDAAGNGLANVKVGARRTGPAYDPSDAGTWGDSPIVAFRKSLERLDAPKVEEEKWTVEGTSREDGAFDLALPESGSWRVIARVAPPLVPANAYVQTTVNKPQAKALLRVTQGSALRVRVVDAADRPLDATVEGHLRNEDDVTGYWQVVRKRSDASTGEVLYDAVPAGKLSLTVVRPGVGSLAVEAKTPREDVLVVRFGAGGVVRGRVADVAGVPVTGVNLTISTSKPSAGDAAGEPSGGTVRATTGADGTYRVEGVFPGNVTTVAAHAEGFTLLQQSPPRAPWSGAEVAAGKETTIDLVLSRGARVSGKAVEAGSGKPLEGVEVTAVQARIDGGWNLSPRATTDAEGRFRLDDVPLGKHVLFPRSATHYFPAMEATRGTGYSYGPGGPSGPPPSVLVVLTKEGETQERDLVLTPGLSIRGRVVGPDGAPVAGATVKDVGGEMWNLAWQWGVNWSGRGEEGRAKSGEDGSFVAAGLAPRPDWVLTASKGALVGVPSDPVAVTVGGAVPEVTLKLETGATIEGRALDAAGKGIFGAQVWVHAPVAGNGASATTDADGAFLVEGVPTGATTVQVQQGRRNVQQTLHPPIAAGEKRTGVELRFEAGHEVSGTVVDAEGKPVAGAMVSVNSSRGQNASANTNADGTFTLSGLPAGKATLQAHVMAAAGGYWESRGSQAVDVPATGVRLALTMSKRTAVVVRVTDAEGGPVPLCLVRVSAGREAQGAMRGYYGGQDGDEVVNGETRREVEGAPPFQVSVTAPRDARGLPMNLRAKTAELADPTVPLTVALEGGHETGGVVVAPDGTGVEGVVVTGGAVSTTSDASGAWRLRGLASADPLDVTVRPPSRWQAPPATKARPGAEDVRIVLQPSAFVAGRVLGPDDKPFVQCGISGSWRTSGGQQGHANAQPDPAGRFRLEGFPADALLQVRAQPWGVSGGAAPRAGIAKDVRAGTEDLVLRLTTGVAIEGRALSADGTKPQNAWISAQRVEPTAGEDLGPSNTAWNEDGTFVLSGLAPGTYVVTLLGNGGPLMEGRRVDAPFKGLDLVVPARAKLVGRLEGEGKLAGYAINVWSATATPGGGARSAGSAKTDEQGGFTLELAGDAEVWLAASRIDDDRYALAGPVRASAGSVVLRLEKGASIDGVLEDPDGTTAADRYVQASADRFQAYGRTDASGRFRIRGLPPGRYRLVGYGKGAAGKLGEADAGTSDLRLRMPVPAASSGR